MIKKFLGVMLTLTIFLSFITVSSVKAQTVEATITSKSFDGENYIIKGRIKVSDLNPEWTEKSGIKMTRLFSRLLKRAFRDFFHTSTLRQKKELLKTGERFSL